MEGMGRASVSYNWCEEQELALKKEVRGNFEQKADIKRDQGLLFKWHENSSSTG